MTVPVTTTGKPRTTKSAATTTWMLDPAHTGLEFGVKHLMISTVRGRFGEVEGTLILDESNPAASKIEVSIPVKSIDTRAEQRDAHLRSGDFFDAERFPTITFRGKRIEGSITGEFRLVGDLTIRDITREITLDVKANGRGRDPWGNEKIAFEARGKLRRNDFGLTWNQTLETGGVLVGEEIRLTIDAQFLKGKDS